jgi:hypothetical protein
VRDMTGACHVGSVMSNSVLGHIKPLQNLVASYYGGEIASPFIRLGSGLRRALLAVFETRGAPLIMRGSFIRLVSSLAGAGTG